MPAMKNAKSRIRPASRAVALEPRILFDGAAAVAAADVFTDTHAGAIDRPVAERQQDQPPAVDATPSQPASGGGGVLVVIDARVADYQSLLADLPANVTVRVIGSDESGLAVIGEALANGQGGQGFDAVHIVSHGTSGSLTLGSDTVNADTLSARQSDVQGWATHLGADADILLYGCDVAEGAAGTAFLEQLARLTGADIAASSDSTGAAGKGGDWELEHQTGSIESGMVFHQAALDSYDALLANVTFTDANGTAVRTGAEDTEFAISGIVMANPDNPANMTLRIQTTDGIARIANLGNVTITAGSNGSNDFTLSGSLADLNAALASLRFTADEHQNSSTLGFTPQIVLTATDVDNGGTGTLVVSNIAVTAVNDAPDLSSGVAIEVSESGSVSLSLDQLATSAGALDADIATGQQVILQQVVQITSLPTHGTLTYKGGAVTVGLVVPVTDLGSLVYTHNGTDLSVAGTDSFGITVSDGGGGVTAGTIGINIAPRNADPVITGAPTLIEGQVKPVAPAIDLGDAFDTLATSTIVIDNIVTGGQGVFFLDMNGDNRVDPGEEITGPLTLTAAQAANLSAWLKFSHNGSEPDAPGAVAPSYRVTVTDAGGGTGVSSNPVSKTITLDVIPNNDDPTLDNAHGTAGSALPVNEGTVTTITGGMLQASDGDRNPANPSQTTPDSHLVYSIESRPAHGEIQVYVGGGLGPDGDGWIVLGEGGRFTQAQIDAGHVRFYQTTDVTTDTLDGFTFTVRDSAFGYDVWTDPANPTGGREGGVRDDPNGPITVQSFHFAITASNNPHDNPYTGGPRPATPGYGGSDMRYDFVPESMTNSNGTATWNEANVGAGGGYVIDGSMLDYTITRTDTRGTPDPSDDVSITLSPAETVYTLTSQPSNGKIERNIGTPGAPNWVVVHTNGQFTQQDINDGTIRFVHDGSENHTASFGYIVSDGTENHYASTFTVNIAPTNDRPVAIGGETQIPEGNNNTVRLGTGALGMSDADGSLDPAKRTGEGAQDFLWFQVSAQPADGNGTVHGVLQRWNGAAWVNVQPGEWLPSSLLSATADGGTSGLRYVHDGSEPLTYNGGPWVTFQYTVRDDLGNPGNPWATNSSAPAVADGSAESNVSTTATATIKVVPVNDAPLIADKPGDTDPVIGGTISGGGSTTGANEILANVPEGGSGIITSAHLTAVDSDNTTVQRQYRVIEVPTSGKLMLNGKVLGVGSTFTQDDIDNNRLQYVHDGSEVGAMVSDGLGSYHDKFLFRVNDGAVETGNKAFLITLSPTNDKPTVSAPGSLEVLGSGTTPTPVPGVSVDDPDLAHITAGSEEDFIRVEVQVVTSGGVVVGGAVLDYTGANPTAGGRAFFSGKGVAGDTLILQGTRAEVNAALATLTVRFGTDEDSSTHRIRVTVDDRLYTNTGTLVATGANGGTTATENTDGTPINAANNRVSKDIVLLASNFNDPPTITNGTAYSVNEDATITLSGYTLGDVDSFGKDVTVTIELFTDAGLSILANTTTQGRLQLGTTTGLTSATGNNGNTIVLTGSISEVQAALNSLKLQARNDFNNGPFYVRATFSDFAHAGGAETASVTNTVNVVPVNDAPVLTVPGDQVLNSGTYLDITTDFNVQDTKDVSQGAADYIEVTVSAVADGGPYGSILIQNKTNVAVTGDGTATVVIRGTNADVTAALRTMRYTPADPNVDKVVTINVTADDRNGGVGNGKEGTGIDGNNTHQGSFTVTVSGTNDAPVVTAPPTVSVPEDSTSVALSGISYADTDDFGGVQQITLQVTHGTLTLGTITGLTFLGGTANGGATITIEGTKAALNAALASLTYTPTANYHGDATLTVTANDRGLVGTGGVQTDTSTVAITVTPINDRPSATTDIVLPAVNEDTASPGATLSGLTFGYSDATDNQTGSGGNTTYTNLSYVAIIGNTATAAQGEWQVSDGAGGWITVPVAGLGLTSALIVPADRQVRFVPAADFNGTPGQLTVRLADGSVNLSSAGRVSTDATTRFDITQAANGGTTQTGAWNAADRTISISVTARNDAPVKTGDPAAVQIDEDAANPAGHTVGSLFGGVFSDAKDTVTGGSSANTLAGIAITGVTTDRGVWEYYDTATSTWLAVPGDASEGDAFVLGVNDQIRFRSTTPDYNGTPTDALNARLIDNSAGAVVTGTRVDLVDNNAGGSTPYSSAGNEVTLGAVVRPLNDAPVLSGTSTDPTFTEGGSAVALISGGSASEVDLPGTVTFGGGTLTVSLDNYRPGDVLSLASLPPGVASVTGGNGAALVITLNTAATPATLGAILEAIRFSNTSDDPTMIKSGTPDTDRVFSIVLNDGNNTNGSANAGGPASLDSNILTGTITIAPVNDPPQATDNTNSVTEDSGVVIGGNVRSDGTADSDPDTPFSGLTVTQVSSSSGNSGTTAPGSTSASNGTTITGKYGTLVIGADGSYTYTLDNSNATVNALTAGQQLTDEVFTYTLSDGSATDTATLTITIAGADDVPAVVGSLPDRAGNDADTGISIPTAGGFNDPEGDPLTYTATGLPPGLTINTSTGLITGTLDPSASQASTPGNQPGTYTVVVEADDGKGNTVTQTFTYTVANPVPVPTDDVVSTPEDTPATGNVLTNDVDPDGDTLTVTGYLVDGVLVTVTPGTPGVVIIPGAGTLSISSNGSYTFTPVPDWHGTVPTVTYTVTDGEGGTTTAELRITVTPVADIDHDTASTRANQSVNIDVLGNDTFEGTTPVVTVAPGDGPSHGTVTVRPDGTIDYTPAAGYVGTDTFTYTVTSGGRTETATVTVTIGNAPPVPVMDTATTPEDTPVGGNVLGNDSDPDGDPLTVTGFEVGGKTYPPGTTATIPGVGQIVINPDGSYLFTPDKDWNGTVPPVTYTVSDGNNGGTATSTLTIVVTPEQDPPVATDDRGHSPDGSPVRIPVLGNDSDPDGDPLTVTDIGGQPITPGGTVQIPEGTVRLEPDGSLTFIPNAGVQGEVVFTYRITDGNGGYDTARVTITVVPEPTVNAPPALLPPQSGSTSPLIIDLLREPEVFDHGERVNTVRRLPQLMHPIIYVYGAVHAAQDARAAQDSALFSDPSFMPADELRSTTIGAGLGFDPNVFVQQAVQQSQRDARFMRYVVEARLSRLSLSSDHMIPTPGLLAPDADDLFQPVGEPQRKQADPAREAAPPADGVAAEAGNSAPVAAGSDATVASAMASGTPTRVAASFSEQLRGGTGRLPLGTRVAQPALAES